MRFQREVGPIPRSLIPGASPQEVVQAVSWSRRNFLRTVTGASVGGALAGLAPRRLVATPRGRKVVVVTFGGGARDEETFMPEGQENIPHLLNELIPRATFFSQVVNRGILGHYVATASLATGVYETFNNFAAVPPDHPTVFEYFRRDLKRPATDAWVVAPSNGFNRIGESGNRSFGPGTGAGVILPKRLLAAALSSASGQQYEHLLRDNYETPLYAPQLSGNEIELHQMAEVLRLSVTDFAAHARTLASPDELSVYIARHLMRRLAPSLLWITLHDVDIAHSGTYSLYIEAIQRTDRLCAEIWKAIQSEPEYSGKTTMFILPDFGRDSDNDPGGNGFQHHRTGDPLSRTTWMIAMGPGIRENVVVERPMESTDLVPTLGTVLGFQTPLSQGKPAPEVA
ncbi:MAG TPA: hypothetical protein VK335_02350 [Bryobacteraceae bacterium]|nr:hypothetical protein [Bryobacteraceae bacterium]